MWMERYKHFWNSSFDKLDAALAAYQDGRTRRGRQHDEHGRTGRPMTDSRPSDVADTDVYITRAFDAPRELVFRFFTAAGAPRRLVRSGRHSRFRSTPSSSSRSSAAAGSSRWSTTRRRRLVPDARHDRRVRRARADRDRGVRRDRAERPRRGDAAHPVPRPRRPHAHHAPPGPVRPRDAGTPPRRAGSNRSTRSTASSPPEPAHGDRRDPMTEPDSPARPRPSTSADGTRDRFRARRHRTGRRARRRRALPPRVRPVAAARRGARPTASPSSRYDRRGRGDSGNTAAVQPPARDSRTCRP